MRLSLGKPPTSPSSFIRINEEGREPPGWACITAQATKTADSGEKEGTVIQRRVGAEEAQLANECERGEGGPRQRRVSREEIEAQRRRGGERQVRTAESHPRMLAAASSPIYPPRG